MTAPSRKIGDVEALPAGVDPEKARIAMRLRQQVANSRKAAVTSKKKRNQVVAGALKAIADVTAAQHRLTDPFERARLHLGRMGIPVFSAAVYEDDFNEATAKGLIEVCGWIVGHESVRDRNAVMKIARRAGWRR